jgi:hypothetical protein
MGYRTAEKFGTGQECRGLKPDILWFFYGSPSRCSLRQNRILKRILFAVGTTGGVR